MFLAASLALAAITSSIAQPVGGAVSDNQVAYVNVTIPAGGYRIISNPLTNGTDSLNVFLPVPDGFDGTSIYRFDCGTQNYRDTMQWVTGPGWLASAPADLIIHPGEGFFVQNIAGIPLTLTMMGEVPAGTLNNTILGANRYCIEASVLPVAGRLGWVGNTIATNLSFPSATGDSVFVFDAATQSYKDTYQYVQDVGWLSNSDPVDGPMIDVAEGFFVQRVAANNALWRQTYSVKD